MIAATVESGFSGEVSLPAGEADLRCLDKEPSRDGSEDRVEPLSLFILGRMAEGHPPPLQRRVAKAQCRLHDRPKNPGHVS